jgi:2-oxoglutarate ferredoxin oxidoreductase subunit delta
MARIRIRVDRCKGCSLCVEVCPKKCLVMDEGLNARGVHPVRYDESIAECGGCMNCILVCPDVAIELEEDESDDES